jgi:integrase
MPLQLRKRQGSPFWWLIGTVAGRRVRESTGTCDEKIAREKCVARENQIHREAIHGRPAARRTFGEVAESYLAHGGPHSADTCGKVARLLVFFGPNIAADEVDQSALDKAGAALLRPNPSPATRLRQIISPVRAVLVHGAKRRMCQMPAFDTGRASLSRTEWLTPDEVDRLIGNAAPHLRPLLVFLAGTGARLGEALKLDWRDVDVQHGRATLRGVMRDGTRGTKNGLDRIVDLCPRVLAGLAYDPRPLRQQRAARLLVGRVFRTRSGKPYAERRVQGGGHIKTGWAAAVTRSKIDKPITPHGLRHTWASWHYSLHKDALLLMRDGGWSELELVQRYAHLTPPGMAPDIEAWRTADTIPTHGAELAQKRKSKSNT